MPITRTPIVDDSGSGTDGTVIDNAWKQEFYNQIDAALGSWTFVTTPLPAGTVHDWNPGIIGHTWVQLTGGAAPFTFTGMKPVTAPVAGQIVHVVNETGQTATMVHQSASSSPGSQLACQGATKTFASYWSWARFQYVPTMGMWVCIGFANGHGI